MHQLSDSNAYCFNGLYACLSSFGVTLHGEHLLVHPTWRGQPASENLRGAKPAIERKESIRQLANIGFFGIEFFFLPLSYIATNS